jgi:hypothetical protein
VPVYRGYHLIAAVVLLTGCQRNASQPPQEQAKSGTLTEAAAAPTPTDQPSQPPQVTAPAGDSPVPHSLPVQPPPGARADATPLRNPPPMRYAPPVRDPAPLRSATPAAPSVATAPIPTQDTPSVAVTRREPPPPQVQSAEVSRRVPIPESAAPIQLQPPAQPAPIPAPGPKPYSGPQSGVVNWSGRIEKGGTVTLDGKLPGVPVMVNIDTKEFAIVEAPSPANGWNRVVVRSKNKRHTVITIGWAVL